eukprot:CAMPEP_0180787390 /NCGR_PEP_ID=MMETSP1038_2-20121128/51357_1 /TAXON_ID=632150 /ORGANISM="Azadinium spinosum, Strain 3D9" /LENGTH=44 /DNA_ID= /DNA_START= /DNA_END= /DNA_ORIENTATION=
MSKSNQFMRTKFDSPGVLCSTGIMKERNMFITPSLHTRKAISMM